MGVNKRKGQVGQAGNAGQWAARTRGEAAVDVLERDVETAEDYPERVRVVGWQNAQLNKHFDATALLTPEEARARAELLDEEQMFPKIQELARQQCARRGAPEHVDDVIGDTAVDLVRRIRDSSDQDKNIRAVVTRALVSRITHGHLQHRLANGEVASTPTRDAQRKLKQRIGQIEQDEHRTPTRREVDRLADEIRMSFPPGRRPDEDFHTGHRFHRDSFEAVDDTGRSMRDTFAGSESHDGSTYLDPTADIALDEQASRQPFDEAVEPRAMQSAELLWHIEHREASAHDITARDVKSSVYNVLAQTTRLPLAKADSLPHRPALAAQKTVLSHEDGATGVAEDYLAGKRTEQTSALFAPFGQIDDERREALASFLSRSGAYGNDLWQSAVRTADRERENYRLPDSARAE